MSVLTILALSSTLSSLLSFLSRFTSSSCELISDCSIFVTCLRSSRSVVIESRSFFRAATDSFACSSSFSTDSFSRASLSRVSRSDSISASFALVSTLALTMTTFWLALVDASAFTCFNSERSAFASWRSRSRSSTIAFKSRAADFLAVNDSRAVWVLQAH